MNQFMKGALTGVQDQLLQIRREIEGYETDAQRQYNDQDQKWRDGPEGETEQNKIDLLHQAVGHLTEAIDSIDDARQ
jgi:hypothetical protein